MRPAAREIANYLAAAYICQPSGPASCGLFRAGTKKEAPVAARASAADFVEGGTEGGPGSAGLSNARSSPWFRSQGAACT